MVKLNDGQIHRILFSGGKLYLDGVQIAGEGISPQKDIVFEFNTNLVPESSPKEDPSVLEVNVHDTVMGKAVGPGQQ